jgi:hypothetical protein
VPASIFFIKYFGLLKIIKEGGKMKKIKGPAIFLAQFVGEDEPFNSLDNICKWASSLGY